MLRPEMAIIRFLHRLRGFYKLVWGVNIEISTRHPHTTLHSKQGMTRRDLYLNTPILIYRIPLIGVET